MGFFGGNANRTAAATMLASFAWLCCSKANCVSVPPRVSAFSSLERVSAYAPLLKDNKKSIDVAAAGGEKESFQIAIRGEENLTATFAVSSSSPIDGTIKVQVQPAGYVWVTNATDSTRVYPFPCPADVLKAEGGCFIADPLLESNNNTTRIVANMTAVLWVTVDVPRGQAAGNYSFHIDLRVKGASSMWTSRVSISLRVFGFDLPTSSYLKNAIHLDVSHLYKSFPGVKMPTMRNIYMYTADWMLRNYRINPGSFYNQWANLTATNLNSYISPFLPKLEDLVRWKEMGMNLFTIPYSSSSGNETSQFVQSLREHAPDLLPMCSFYGFDEFSGPFSEIAKTFLPLRDEFPEIRTMSTAHVGLQYPPGLVKDPVSFDPKGLSSLGVTSIIPQTNYLPPRSNISAVQNSGKEVWTYTSLQPYKPKADMRLDNPLIDIRGLFWQIFSYGFDGYLYWGVNQWVPSLSSMRPIPPISASSSADYFPDLPLISPDTWDVATYPPKSGNLPWLFGDGKMLYAGEGEQVAIGSLRLAAIRDALDDYDYLYMLRKGGDGALAEQLATAVGGSDVDGLDRDPANFAAARVRAGSAVEKMYKN